MTRTFPMADLIVGFLFQEYLIAKHSFQEYR
jgi:hypothetical protein